ncbi:MAG: monosaccharide transporter substrate-binding protein family [Chloroflexi bacterium]|jgi:rhamnose transport system substrate-binding protein|nr:monosaccharide transporter substrate-binding protein family [Chloroflexota bacterium]
MKLSMPVKGALLALLVANPIFVGAASSVHHADAKSYKILFITKIKGISVFADVKAGGAAAAKANGDTFEQIDPADANASTQVQIINTEAAKGWDAIGISANDPTVGNAFTQAGVKAFTWDSDVLHNTRTVFVNQVSEDVVGKSLLQILAKQINYKGGWAILSATPTSTNQNTWIAFMKKEAAKPQYKNMHLIKIAYGGDTPDKSFTEAQALLQNPAIKGIISPTSVGVVQAARAIEVAHLSGKVQLTGLGFAKDMRKYIMDGTSTQVGLWSFFNLGYLGEEIGHAIAAGTFKGKIGETVKVGKLGTRTVTKNVLSGGSQVLLGPLDIYNKANVDAYIAKGG